jgi:hypothetical protein
MLQVVDVGAEAGPDPSMSGLLLPVVRDSDSVELESRDGAQVRRFEASGLALYFRNQEVLRFSRIAARLLVTDARVAIVCSHYDRGGGWRGDPISMGVFNTVSKLRAAVRSRGQALVGQARYPWIARVGSTARVALGGEERLVIDASETERDTYRLIIGLSNRADAANLAAEIVRRTAAFRLVSERDLDPEERLALTRLQVAAAITPSRSRPNDHIYFHEMPSCWYRGSADSRHANRRI